MFGFSKKKFQVNLAPHKKVRARDITIRPQKIALLLFVLAAIFVSIFLFATTTPSFSMKRGNESVPTNSAPVPIDPNGGASTMALVIAEIQKQYLLPQGEVPTMALITSLDELQGQAFFAKAQVDDIVLMYMEAKKGILWRPSTRQIVEVGPILATRPPADTVDSDIQKDN